MERMYANTQTINIHEQSLLFENVLLIAVAVELDLLDMLRLMAGSRS